MQFLVSSWLIEFRTLAKEASPHSVDFYGVFEAVTGEVESLVTASVSGNTVKKYNFAVSKFQELCNYELFHSLVF